MTDYCHTFVFCVIQLIWYGALRKYFFLSSQMRVCRPSWTLNTLLLQKASLALTQNLDWSSWAGKELGRLQQSTPSWEEQEGFRAGSPRRSVWKGELMWQGEKSRWWTHLGGSGTTRLTTPPTGWGEKLYGAYRFVLLAPTPCFWWFGPVPRWLMPTSGR